MPTPKQPAPTTVEFDGIYAQSLPRPGAYVTTMPGVYWTVRDRVDEPGGITINLDPCDGHDIPLDNIGDVTGLPPRRQTSGADQMFG